MTILKRTIFIAVALAVFGAYAFAGGNKESGQSQNNTQRTIVRVGTEGAYPPYNFVDSSRKVDGYDMAVIRAVEKLLPEYQFEFVPTAWDGIFTALEGGSFDLIASNIAWRAEREQKYYLSTVPYLWSGSQLVFKAGRTDIRSLRDLNGKKVAAGVGTATTTQLEEYIGKTGAPIEIVYTDGNIATALLEIDTGRVDATISSIITTQLVADSLGIKVDGSTISEWEPSSIHFLFSKTEKGRNYRDRIDSVISQLHANGVLAALSREYLFGRDYTTKDSLLANR
jgi:L-cystine transport system substrate-binding protein